MVTLKPEDIAARMAWTRGELHFANTSLEESVEEFNRYNVRRLRIRDPAIRTWKVAGVYTATDPETFALLIKRSLGVRFENGTSNDGHPTIDLLAPKE